MTFKKQYFDKDFLRALDERDLRTTACVMKTLGCDRKTAKAALERLLIEGKVGKLLIDSGASCVWIRLRDIECVGIKPVEIADLEKMAKLSKVEPFMKVIKESNTVRLMGVECSEGLIRAAVFRHIGEALIPAESWEEIDIEIVDDLEGGVAHVENI